MSVNPRKSLTFRNRTNYFDPERTKTFVTVISPNTYKFATSKQQGYYNRLYWEFRYCQEHRGQTFYYTLTYNDGSMPKFEGRNCFDYNDLVYLLNGGFKKYLLRHYGTSIKYFVGAELGEGAGSRGMHNNPHYHILFFLRSAESEDYPYKLISPLEFRHLVRKYWQGFDQDIDGYQSYNTALRGIAKEGKNLGLVTDFRACYYVSKYVTKDVGLKRFEKSLHSTFKARFESDCKTSCDIDEAFWRQYIIPHYNIPTKVHLDYNHSDWKYSDSYLLELLDESIYKLWNNERKRRFEVQFPVYSFVRPLVDAINLRTVFKDFSDKYIDNLVKDKINTFRNRFSNKCRISQGVGDYALDFVQDTLNPSITVPTDSGYKTSSIGLYYYRKLYTQVVKDPFGKPIRVLNTKGIEYKLHKYESDFQSLCISTLANLEILSSELYAKMLSSDVNDSISISFEAFSTCLVDKHSLIKKYAEYKLVYEGRYYALNPSNLGADVVSPDIDPLADLRCFLQPAYFYQPYNFSALSDFLDAGSEAYLPYSFHPYFCDCVVFFGVIDLLAAYLFTEDDAFKESQKRKRDITHKFHKGLDLISFYNQFK